MRIQSRQVLGFVLAGLLLAGCQSTNIEDYSSFGDSAASVDDLSDVSFYPADELVALGVVQFNERNFGKSYALFKRAVSVFPEDPLAWLGYAASADQIGRFDNADNAYRLLATMIPDSPVYLNNVGYSHLLRGDLPQARRYFLKAYEKEPGNETTANNIELLRNSASFAKRGS